MLGMFKLIALVNLKDGAPVDEILERGRAVLAREPAISRFELIKDAGEEEGHFTVPHATFALHCEFESREHWRRYVDGPIHKEMSGLIADWRVGATVLQGYC